MAEATSQGRIRKLDQAVVNRIAAGEVIQRPANALKELIENCLDAKATSIQITVKSGGMKLLQIQDDGCGIHADDLPVVCERFTTSKLREFEDLETIATYGFRGEALASMSHVAHLTLVSKTADARCAFRARYQDGKLLEVPRPCAGTTGTRICLEDLFYNVATRRNALRSHSEEHGKVAEVASRYAIHNSGRVAFSLKKQGESGAADLRTVTSATVEDNVRVVYGPSVSRELLDVSCRDEGLSLSVSGRVTNLNYSAKKCIFLLFINHRLVECTALRKALEKVYESHLPKGGHPFLYLSLEMDPHTLDVNVHPTKQEVHFLREGDVVRAVQAAVEGRLLSCSASRTFFTQALLPGAGLPPASGSSQEDASARVYDHQMVRTDCREQKLDKFFGSPGGAALSTTARPEATESSMEPKASTSQSSSQSRREVKLTSVLRLRKEVEDDCHQGLRELLKEHTFVGCVDRSKGLLQHQTRLYLCNTTALCQELFFQLILYEFGNMGYLRLSEAAPISSLVLLALDQEESGWSEEDGTKEDLSSYIHEFLVAKRTMLEDYFSVQVDKEGNLRSIPMLLENYVPALERLPMYIVRLATEVDWDTEKECFYSFARETANFYARMPLHDTGEDKNGSSQDKKAMDTEDRDEKSVDWKWNVEHVFFPACRQFLLPPKHFADDGTFLQIADLPDLYKVFERC